MDSATKKPPTPPASPTPPLSPRPLPPRPSAWKQFLAEIGLQGKLILAFSLLLMIGLSTSSWMFVKKSRETLEDILGEQARQISQTLAMAAATPYANDDMKELDRLGKELLKGRNLVLVGFFDPDGQPLAVSCRDPEFATKKVRGMSDLGGTQNLMQVQQRFYPTLGPFLQINAPVFDMNWDHDGPRLLGYLTVGISQNSEEAQLHRVSLLGVGVGCVIFVLSLPMASGLVHRIFLPIRQLVTATNRIASGDYDAHVATQRPDEIGMLARSFNEMVLRIKEHQDQLRVANEHLADANRGLEERVKQRTRELEHSNARLSSEIAEKEDFLRAVSHDLNAPLRNISGMAAMLLIKYRERFDDDIIHRLERIRKNVELETDLIAELLELSRIKTRRQRMEQVDLNALLNDVRDIFENDLKQKQIALVVETGLPILMCEKARLRQVFQNLIDNSIKYMGDGEAREIEISHRVGEDGIEFQVRDTGIGIDPEDLPKVFYVFRRGKNTAEVNVPGKGVGLASVKSIIETYDGRIWVQSEVGQGSTFRFTIAKKFVPSLGGNGKHVDSEADESAREAVST
jgi:signal transduction histidine kinase